MINDLMIRLRKVIVAAFNDDFGILIYDNARDEFDYAGLPEGILATVFMLAPKNAGREDLIRATFLEKGDEPALANVYQKYAARV
jgi:hypothetical protein